MDYELNGLGEELGFRGLIWRVIVFVLGNSWVHDRHRAVSWDGVARIPDL